MPVQRAVPRLLLPVHVIGEERTLHRRVRGKGVTGISFRAESRKGNEREESEKKETLVTAIERDERI